MGLKKFNGRIDNQSRKKKIVIIAGIILVLITIMIIQSYALYKNENKNKILDGRVGSFGHDIEFAVHIYNETTEKYEKTSEFPKKDSGKSFEKVECDNGNTGTWNITYWHLVMNKITGPAKCNVYFTEYPIIVDITDNMIPVMYDGTNWVKADENNQDSTYKWYDYYTQQWANAVLVKASGTNSRDYYKNNTPVGTKIEDADILAYYVYIPRYKYQLWNAYGDGLNGGSLGPREIQIEFENNKAEISTGTTNGEWLTHPAFCFGNTCDTNRSASENTELNGIWVGKFETTGTLTANGITIRPWISSTNTATAIVSQTVGSMFSISRAIQTTTNNIYGFPDSTKADSHMMKNMEWGAVAYLTNSKYGKNSEVWINNSNTMQTGCAGTGVSATGVSGCANAYTTTNGQKASTTGNISGIYDMSGGAVEYVMGNMVASTSTPLGTLNVQSAGTFSPTPALKYYDSYAYDAADTSHKRGKLGDATKENLTTFGDTYGGWNSDYSLFLDPANSWFRRGGHFAAGERSGVFAFSNYTGGTHGNFGFRLVYTIS